MFAASNFGQAVTTRSHPHKEPLSRDFSVRINGTEVPVYTCRISKYPFNTVWPGHQRTLDQTVEASFVNIVSDEAVRLEVTPAFAYERVYIKPYSKEIDYTEENGAVVFTLSQNGGHVLQCDSHHHTLYIFNSKPIVPPSPDGVTHYFGPGIHFPGKITLHSNESVYVDRDALVYGCLFADGAENIRVFGNGVLDDSTEERVALPCYDDYTNGNMKFYDCRNLSIEGVGITNSAIWCLNLFHCFDVQVTDLKVFGQWRYNTDGIDIVNSQHIRIEHSFIHSFDDTVTIKGIAKYVDTDCRDIHVHDCVLVCDWGKCCEVGVETACREYADISFVNCDILHVGNVAIDIANGICAEVHHILFKDIRVECNRFDTPEVYQCSDDMMYDKQDTQAVARIVYIGNFLWMTPETCKTWGIPESEGEELAARGDRMVHDVTVQNIRVYYEDGLPLADGRPLIRCFIDGAEDKPPLYNIRIKHVAVNGVRMTAEEIGCVIRNAVDCTVE